MPCPRRNHQEATSLSNSRGDIEWFDPLVAGLALRVNQAGLNIRSLEPGIAFQNRLEIVAGGEHSQDVFDSQTSTANNRLAAKDLRIDRDTFEQLCFGYGSCFRAAIVVTSNILSPL